MRSSLINDHLHNPFHNRFNVPVTCRRSEMQAYAYKVWLPERNQDNSKTQTNSTSPMVVKQTTSISDTLELAHWTRLFVTILALLLVLLASAVMLKAL